MSVTVVNAMFVLLGLAGTFIIAQGTCVHNDIQYEVGQSLSGDPCDRCTCTQYGVMCELVHCTPALCVDKYVPEGQCCEVCPNGVNCLHSGPEGSQFQGQMQFQGQGQSQQGHVIIPEAGCEMSANQECFCYYENGDSTKMRTYCIPKFEFLVQMRGHLAQCTSNTN